MNIKASFLLFLFLHLFAAQFFASGCCKLEIANPDEHKITCISFSAASCMAATVTTGFAAVAVMHASSPALCVGNSIAAGCTASAGLVLMGCSVRQHTLMQVSEQLQQRSGPLQRLLVPSQQSMMVSSADSRQERVGFSPNSDEASVYR